MAGYTKLFASILDSTVWNTPGHVRLVWITMLAMSDHNGLIEASVPGLAKRAGVSLSETEEALACFTAPDPYSRSKVLEGRRLIEVDGGWELVNHDKYRRKQNIEDVRERAAERVRRHRSKPVTVTPEPLQSVTVTPSNECNASNAIRVRSESDQKDPPLPPRGPIDFPDRVAAATLSPAGSAHGQECRDGWAAAWEAAGQGSCPVLTGQNHAAAVEFARRVAKANGVGLYDAAKAIAAHVIAHGKRGNADVFDLARMDPYVSTPAPKQETGDEHNRRVNHVGESYEAYLARRKADPFAQRGAK